MQLCKECGIKEVYCKGLCVTCYKRNWSKENKDKVDESRKKYFSQFTGFYLYLIKDLDGKIMYVGKTTNYMMRFYNQMIGNVVSTKEFIGQGNYTIQYINLTGIIETELELLALENELIELYETELNHRNKDNTYRLTDVSTIEEGRLFELICSLHNFDSDWITYCTCKKSTKKMLILTNSQLAK